MIRRVIGRALLWFMDGVRPVTAGANQTAFWDQLGTDLQKVPAAAHRDPVREWLKWSTIAVCIAATVSVAGSEVAARLHGSTPSCTGYPRAAQ